MADVKVKLSVDTREAEAKLRELELRAGRLNARTGVTPTGRVTGRVPGIVTIERPGTATIIDIPEPARIAEGAPSNAALSAAIGGAAGVGVSGAMRGTGQGVPQETWYDMMRRRYHQSAGPRPYAGLSDRQLLVTKQYMQDVQLGLGKELVRNRWLVGRAGKLNFEGMSLQQMLFFANSTHRANASIVADVAKVRDNRERLGLLEQERTLRRQMAASKPNALSKLYYKVDNLPSLVSLRERGGLVAGPIATLSTVTAGAIVLGSIAKGLANSADRLSANIRSGTDYQGSVARVMFEEILKSTMEKTFRPAMEAERKIITIAGKAEAALAYAFGAKDRAAAILQVTDQYSGELMERNKALIALQDQWSRGFDQAGQAGLAAARQQSSSSGHRAIQLGLRGGTLLEIDRSLYHEIADKTQRKYQQEYAEKVTYPKMGDVQGDRK